MMFTVNGKKYRWNPSKLIENILGIAAYAALSFCIPVMFYFWLMSY